MKTIKRICDQIIRLYKDGHPTDDVELDTRDIKEIVCQQANVLMKTEYLQVNMQTNNVYPPHTMIATYEDIPLETASNIGFSVQCELMGNPFSEDISIKIEKPNDKFIVIITTSKAVELKNYIDNCPFGSFFSIEGLPSQVPSEFLKTGITDLSNTETQVTFCYDQNATFNADAWITEEGQYWMTEEGVEWITDETTSLNPVTEDSWIGTQGAWITEDSENWITNAINGVDFPNLGDYTAKTKAIFDEISGEENYNNMTFTNVKCCAVKSNLETLDTKFTLPAIPIQLPMNIGVWRVYRAGTPSDPFIPLQSMQYGIVGGVSHTNLETILGSKVCYEYFSHKEVRINQSIPLLGVTKVNVQLLVVDPTTLGFDDLLQLPPDMEAALVNSVLETLTRRIGVRDSVNNEEDDRNR